MTLRQRFRIWNARSNPAAELARRGAAIRQREWITKRNAKVAELCAGMGKPVPDAIARQA